MYPCAKDISHRRRAEPGHHAQAVLSLNVVAACMLIEEAREEEEDILWIYHAPPYGGARRSTSMRRSSKGLISELVRGSPTPSNVAGGSQ